MRKHRKLCTIIALAAAITAAIVASVRLVPESPLAEVNKAGESLAAAGRNRADTYSGGLYREAKANYDSAMTNWKRENGRFIFFRNYDRVRLFAEACIEKSELALESSKNNSASLKGRIEVQIDTLNSLVSELNRIFSSYPLESELRNRILKGKILLRESELAFEKGDYLESFRKITDAGYMLESSWGTASGKLRDYFSSFSKWKTWVDKTIRESRRTGGYSIVVDKFSHTLSVYQRGERKKEYHAEFGRNWVGDKRLMGDFATPEGMYKVSKKLDRGRTKYHKALLLDYPNPEDLADFKRELQAGTVPPKSKPGGLIEIHGNGGKGTDWTEGCIALSDTEMDALFRIAAPGTPVTIVGSTSDLASLFKK